MMTIDTTNLCSHLQKKLFEPEGVYYPIWQVGCPVRCTNFSSLS